jgi:hypothetical protein
MNDSQVGTDVLDRLAVARGGVAQGYLYLALPVESCVSICVDAHTLEPTGRHCHRACHERAARDRDGPAGVVNPIKHGAAGRLAYVAVRTDRLDLWEPGFVLRGKRASDQ